MHFTFASNVSYITGQSIHVFNLIS